MNDEKKWIYNLLIYHEYIRWFGFNKAIYAFIDSP